MVFVCFFLLSIFHKIAFTELSYKVVGEYHYTISEVVPETPDMNLIYDATKYTVVVSVTEDADANKLKAQVTYYNAETEQEVAAAVLTNRVVSGDAYQIRARKTMQGRSFREGDRFTFTLEKSRDQGASFQPFDSQTITPHTGSNAEIVFKEDSYSGYDAGLMALIGLGWKKKEQDG